MIRIGICDDEPIFRQQIYDYIREYLDAGECDIVLFAKGEEILSYQYRVDLLFLDIELGKENGIDILKALVDLDYIWRVVFVTAHKEFMPVAFSVKTIGFLEKPVTYGNIIKYIKQVENSIHHSEVVQCNDGQHTFFIRQCDILYVHAAGNYCEICTHNKEIMVDGNLKEWERKMNDFNVMRVHKSYLVNLDYIKDFSGCDIMMINNIKLPVGRHYKKDAKEQYFNYLKNKL
ncbi:DNA-binding response regulator [Intestinibaculum porci]|uniref:DNA-binding response regulator n=1 Tax=Intestinibaculum porci TaxID=2487118 RepID=A0A3G9JC32_9FIRM|nr:LytTR family DNA-binding domain-containing protein [Intestinibaculum porci]BBH27902.1 DNA-binding response regulator [Intestinibaculum porci]